MKQVLPLLICCLAASFAQAQNPSFTAQPVSLSGTSGCVVDMNGDFLDDIVGVNATSVNILYQLPNGAGFTAATLQTPAATFLPNWSIAAGDIDNNGKNDLLYGASNGVSFMKQNSAGTGFTQMSGPNYVFSQRSNFADMNGDSFLDAFVCHDVEPNVYYINDGTGVYTFNQGGIGDFASGGNYGSIWVDYDNDGDSDLFIAKCRGGNSGANIDELHRNNGDGTFTNVSVAAGMAEPSQSWSSAWGDFDNDGDMDALIGASSFITGGHKLRKNNGDGTFTDVTPNSGYDVFLGQGHEYVAHDFNNDGWIDILGSGNTIMINNGNMTFTPVEIGATTGSVGDFNDDGFLDIRNGNTLYMNNANPNKWIKINIQGIQSNRNGIGARVELHGPWGMQIRDVRSGDGFEYMSSLNTHFGIGNATEITKVVVKWPSGLVDEIVNPGSNQALFVLEGSSPALGVSAVNTSQFSMYPNPAKDVINISFKNSEITATTAQIFDMTGKSVFSSSVVDSKINVQSLAPGMYIILLKDASGKRFSQKFLKN